MSAVTIKSAVLPDCATGVRIYPCEGPLLAGYASFVIGAGAAHIQTYATAAELRAIAHAATLTADELEMAARPVEVES